ncbi:DUF1365 domain-containing protein [Oxalobacteraceae bacterium OM1]|nr:DUF1365 domain-containing protein [Oxalobacteraceae bacterium OM1]
MAALPNGVQIGLGDVRHARLRPVQHAFRYGVFFLRLPLRALGGRDFGLRLVSRNRFNLLSFHDADHGDGVQPPVQWIDNLLRRECVRDADGEIWLQTFPRVLGYVFNPVSFWFCHRADGALRAVVCEVNNTFGERHYYLLDTGTVLGAGTELQARKVFHVSPFCRVEGRYRFRFLQREAGAGAPGRVVARIDYDDLAGPLLQTSLSGRLHPLTDGCALRACLCHPLMTLGVIVRIHWQALQLWRKRVPFFRKPLPHSTELSR